MTEFESRLRAVFPDDFGQRFESVANWFPGAFRAQPKPAKLASLKTATRRTHGRWRWHAVASVFGYG